MSRSLTADMNDPNLFEDNRAGEYTYSESGLGKSASGQLFLCGEPNRDADAQRNAGGEARRQAGGEYGVDDGGHLIAARFGGSSSAENLVAQDRNLNRGSYKRMENDWASHLERGDKVFVHMEVYDPDNTGRPTSYMGYAIYEHIDEHGNVTRECEDFSFNNESRSEMEKWDAAEREFLAAHPEIEEENDRDNVMPYHWDDAKGELVENPYYVPEENETQSAGLPADGTEEKSSNTDYGISDEAAAEKDSGEQNGFDYVGVENETPGYGESPERSASGEMGAVAEEGQDTSPDVDTSPGDSNDTSGAEASDGGASDDRSADSGAGMEND